MARDLSGRYFDTTVAGNSTTRPGDGPMNADQSQKAARPQNLVTLSKLPGLRIPFHLNNFEIE